jgi:predicted unusual protein kinase regulating ubiquinone biosynthesis (AarF/ABC1/UbiB family)
MELVKSLHKTVDFYVRFEHNRLVKKYTPRQLGAWSKNKLASMGPTFIKIGQFVSTRSDIFSKDITDELKELQDNVAPLPWKDLKENVPLNTFSNINEFPLASASIGQVHLATLQDKEVIIKVKRPNIDGQIKADFEGLLFFIKALKTFSTDRRLMEFEVLFTEYYKLLLEEVDFVKEANNMRHFSKMFEDITWIKIPQVYKQFSNSTCITMEYVPSIKINEIDKLREAGYSTEKIATKLLESYVEQIIKHGSVHIDPHPGNVGITKNGKIVFYDYGMVLDLDELIQKHFDELLVALYDKDVDEIARLAVEIGLVVIEPKNLAYFKKFLIFFLSYIEKMNIDDFKVSYLDNLSKTDMPFILSSKFLLLLRGISILEGCCKSLDKNFNYKRVLDPYIQDYLIDIKYIESKALLDINAIQQFPSKIKEQQIELEIMRMNLKLETNDREDRIKKKIAGSMGVFAMMFIMHDVPLQIYAALLTTILLF